MPLWELYTMAWNPAQTRMRTNLDDGALINVFSGANYSAKTFGVVAMALRACAGMEKWCATPANVALCGLSLAQSRQAFQQYLVRFLQSPGLGDCVHNATKREGLYQVIEFCNGSMLDILTVGQGADLHQGSRRSLICYDEEPTYDVFEEGLFRFRSGMESRLIFSMTPTHGRSWVWDNLVDKAEERNVARVTATLFENCVFFCKKCQLIDVDGVDQTKKEPHCECAEPDWVIPPCPACGKDRKWWDNQLDVLGLVRSPDIDPQAAKDWMYLQVKASKDVKVDLEGGACGRCWTHGAHPRASAKQVRNNLLHVSDPKRIAMRFCGWWEELDGQSCITRAQMKAMRGYAQ